MINICKPENPTEKCLDCLEKQKNYKCCNDLLVKYFYNKCYLCEQKNITDLTTEHFIPHKGNEKLKFIWKNLFLSCSYCNSAKLEQENLLDCTDFNIIITNEIGFEFTTNNGKDKVKISALNSEISLEIQNTIDLLNNIHNGNITLNSKLKSSNLRIKIFNELQKFKNILESNIIEEIKKELNYDSEFLAFKIWYIKRNIPNTELINLLPKFTKKNT